MTALLLAVLFSVGILSILMVALGDDGLEATNFWIILGITPVIWTGWGLILYRFLKRSETETVYRRFIRWLLAGSILELLIAVPSHVIVRQRGDCCAPGGTFLGIATGISVMLMTFGPGVLFLYADRMRRKRQNVNDESLEP